MPVWCTRCHLPHRVPHHDGVETNLHSESGFASVRAALTASVIASSIKRGVPAAGVTTKGTTGTGEVDDEDNDEVEGIAALLACRRSSSVDDLTAADAHEEERSKETSRM